MRNIVSSAFTFLTDANYRHSHFVVGGRVDPFTAVLAPAWPSRRRWDPCACAAGRAWLTAATVFLLAVSAIQQYGYVAITRTFILLPVFAVFAGLGEGTLANLIMPFNPALRRALTNRDRRGALGFNQFHIEYVSAAQQRFALRSPCRARIAARRRQSSAENRRAKK